MTIIKAFLGRRCQKKRRKISRCLALAREKEDKLTFLPIKSDEEWNGKRLSVKSATLKNLVKARMNIGGDKKSNKEPSPAYKFMCFLIHPHAPGSLPVSCESEPHDVS